jgi:hypothetical protein
MLKASTQIDLYDNDNPNGWHNGIFTKKSSATIKKKNTEVRKKAAAPYQSIGKRQIGKCR